MIEDRASCLACHCIFCPAGGASKPGVHPVASGGSGGVWWRGVVEGRRVAETGMG